MKTSIFIATSVLAILCSINDAEAQKTKRLESSSRRVPKWVYGIEKDYIIATGSGSSIDVAKQNALIMVKHRIITSVAENIQSWGEYVLEETTSDNISSFFENYEMNIKAESADIEYVKGISLSKVEEFYWEKVRTDRDIRFNYSIKYPFSQIRLQSLVAEFERADRELTDQLNSIVDSIDEVTSVEEIQKNIKVLRGLSKSFSGQRKIKAESGVTQLSSLLRSVSIEPVESSLGKIVFILKIGDKVVTCAKNPNVASQCADITSVLNKGDSWEIRYTYDNCGEGVPDVVDVKYKFGGVKTGYEFLFDATTSKVDFFLNGSIYIKSLSRSGRDISKSECLVTLTSKHNSTFIVNKVVLEWRGLPPLELSDINREFSGKGDHELRIAINQKLNDSYSSTKQSMVKGYITATSKLTGETTTFRLYNQSINTDW